jgi:hypothetical protein
MIQTISCPCGKVFAACVEPFCYEDAEWQSEMRKYIKRGCTVGLIENGHSNPLQKCTCSGMKPSNQPELPLTFHE